MLPDIVNKIMCELCDLLIESVSIQSVYVYGSTALGDFIEGSSDIDFIIIVNDTLSAADLLTISAAHKEMEKAHPETELMGAYICQEDLGKPAGEIPSLLTYYNKQVRTNGEGNDINPVTWWILKYHGIRLIGPDVPFKYEIKVESLIQYVIHNMNTYWAGWVERLERQLQSPEISEQAIQANQLDYAVEWCVLGMLRQLYTIKEHGVISKISAGTFGAGYFPDRWHGLIREAVAIKRREPYRMYQSQVNRLNDLVELLRLIVMESNRLVR